MKSTPSALTKSLCNGWVGLMPPPDADFAWGGDVMDAASARTLCLALTTMVPQALHDDALWDEPLPILCDALAVAQREFVRVPSASKHTPALLSDALAVMRGHGSLATGAAARAFGVYALLYVLLKCYRHERRVSAHVVLLHASQEVGDVLRNVVLDDEDGVGRVVVFAWDSVMYAYEAMRDELRVWDRELVQRSISGNE